MSSDDKAKGLNKYHGVTAGTVTAGKAVVVDSNKDIASFRNVTLTGTLTTGTLDITEGSGTLPVAGIRDTGLVQTSATNSGTTSAATANSMSGFVRIPGLTTAAGNFHVCTVTNSNCSTTAVLQITPQYLLTFGTPIVFSTFVNNGSFSITIKNIDATTACAADFSFFFLIIQS